MADQAGLEQLDQRRAAATAPNRPERLVPTPKHRKAAVTPTTPATEPALPKAAEVTPEGPTSVTAPRRRSRVRPTQVHLDEASEAHLAALKRQAVVAGAPFTASAALRLALHELIEAHGYDGVLSMLSADPSQSRTAKK